MPISAPTSAGDPTEINIKDFGIGVPSYMGITVAEKVQVRVGFPARLEASPDAAAR